MTFPDLPSEASVRGIDFTAHGVELPSLLREGRVVRVASWLGAVAKTHGAEVVSLDYVLCDDAFLHAMNIERLGHDTLTDIITFDLGEGPSHGGAPPITLEGECYVSLERVIDNATSYTDAPVVTDREVLVADELRRVLAHGLLHLCGLDDGNAEEVTRMRAAEERALYIWRAKFGPEATMS